MIYSISFLIHESQPHSLMNLQLEPIVPIPRSALHEKAEKEAESSTPQTLSEPKLGQLQSLRSLNSIISSKSDDLESFKDLGGRGTTIDPITHRQVISAYAKQFNSTRYEVPLSPFLAPSSQDFLSDILVAHPVS
jgi:hypothetical protein